MFFYLTTYTGSGTDDDPFQPHGFEQAKAFSIDLRPDSTVVSGWALVCVLTRDDVGIPGHYLGDDIRGVLTARSARMIGNDLGVTCVSRELGKIVMELLLEHGDDTRPNRWNRLRPASGRYEVWLGDLIATQPVVSGGDGIILSGSGARVFTESFNQSDSSTLGPNIAWTELTGDLRTTGNRLRVVGLTTTGAARAEVDLASSDNYSQMEVPTWNVSDAGLLVSMHERHSASAFTCYGGRWFLSGTHRVIKIVTGTATTLASGTDTVAAGDVVKGQALGSTVSSIRNGAQKLSVTDTAITAGLRAGVALEVGTAVTNLEGDNFEMGDLSVPGSRPFVAQGAAYRASSW